MKKIIAILIIIICQPLLSQWEQTSWKQNSLPIYICYVGGDTVIITSGDNTPYYTNSEFFISTNSGNTWEKFGIGISFKTNKFAIIDSIVFASGVDSTGDNIYKSTNLGITWEHSYKTNAISFFSLDNNIYAGTGKGILLTSDFGKTWVERNNGIEFKGNHKFIYQLVNIGNNLVVSTYTGIYLSTDFGESWVLKINGISEYDYRNLKYLTVVGTNIIAGTFLDLPSGGTNVLYTSTDLGETWINYNQDKSPIARIYVYDLIGVGDKVLIHHTGDYKSDYRSQWFMSKDLGISWENKTKELPFPLYSYDYTSIATDGSIIYVSVCSSLFVSKDSCDTWIQLTYPGTNYGPVETIYSKGNDIYVGTTPSLCVDIPDGIFMSNNNGETWQPLGLEDFWVPSVCVAKNNIIAGTNHGVLISSDGGINWQEPEGLPQGIIVLIFADDNENVFASSGKGIYFSSNNGINWELRNNGLPSRPWANSIASTGDLVIAGLDSGVWISSDLGLNWYEKNNGLPLDDRTVWSVGASNNTIFMSTRNNLYRSTDLGENWELKKEGLPQYDLFVNSFAFYEDYIFIATGRGIYISSNNGDTWIPKNDGIVNIDGFFTSIVISGEYIFTGTNGAGFGTKGDKVYRAKISDLITDVEENGSKPLFSIYPNPATNFLYINNQDVTGKIEIISALGIIVLECKYQNKIDVSSLNPGLYFLKVEDRITKFIKY
ncbi:MAG: T9SS type A sorting domain-containing protein [bacterium]